MNNAQLLREILEDDELKKFWKEEQTSRLNMNTIGSTSPNIFLKLVKLSLPEKKDVITTRKLRNQVENLFNQ